MNSMLLSPAALATPRTAAPAGSSNPGAALVAAARLLLPDLERGRAIDAHTLRNAMSTAFGGSDAEGAWNWKTAYDACEAAQILFLRKFGLAMRKRAASRSRPTISCLNPQPALGSLRSMPSSLVHSCISTNSRMHARVCSMDCSAALASPGMTLLTSTIISMPTSVRPSC